MAVAFLSAQRSKDPNRQVPEVASGNELDIFISYHFLALWHLCTLFSTRKHKRTSDRMLRQK